MNYFFFTCYQSYFSFNCFPPGEILTTSVLTALSFTMKMATENNITAHPHSVNVLPGVVDDIRTPDKLIDGVNDTYDGRHMWLAPILPGLVRTVCIIC